eukprot:373417_1
MSFEPDPETKMKMQVEMNQATDKYLYNKFKNQPLQHKAAYQCMAHCFDKYPKAKQTWNCMKECRRTLDNGQMYLQSIITEYLTEPVSECAQSTFTSQSLSNQEYIKCVKQQIGVFQKVRNEC